MNVSRGWGVALLIIACGWLALWVLFLSAACTPVRQMCQL